MPTIPVDEVIAHLHGIGAEYVTGAPGNKQATGGGIASLDITRTADGYVCVAIKFMFRVFEFRVSQKEWDHAFGAGRITELQRALVEACDGWAHQYARDPEGNPRAQIDRLMKIAARDSASVR